jgi:hypothetical protein
MPKSTNKYTSELQLIVESELKDLVSASQNLNPYLTYVRFILTDSMPNANGHIIPQEEFSNLIQTGLYMPLKMAVGEIKEGHSDAVPLGVITHLRVDGNKVRGVAALWNKERPADIAFIKERYADGEPLDLSWEIGFDPDESQYNDEGYRILRGCVLRATTLVGIPAYEGRTNITDVDMSSDKSKEEETVKELEQLQQQVETLQTELQAAKEEIKELKKTQLTDEVQAELERLQEFEVEILAEAKKLEVLAEIRNAFNEAGVEKDDEFFAESEEQLLALKEGEVLDFFIANLVSEEEEEEESEEEEELEEDTEDVEDEEDSEKEDLEDEEASKFPKIRRIKVGEENHSITDIAQALRKSKQQSK